MAPRLTSKQTIRILAFDSKCGRLYPGLFTWLIIEGLSFETVSFSPAHVHPEQHLSPILGIGTTGSSVYGNDGIAAVVLTAEQHLSLTLLNFSFEPSERL